uniref:Uncharacterized protein n=1 Tax=Guillardia theta TaxID=55529 RepID=A0A6U6CKZ8_GUITH|mmetsp:Transcript_47363/g.148125  ORF Transcript_47363/g.148125 Transcript_47363/m.148125 type:complete len:191 (+) Transcript_47363:225-797(+)
MTLDSSRTHRSDPEGLIQSYVLRVEEKNRLAESEWKKESASCFHADSLPDSQHIRSKKPRKPRRWQMRRSGRGRGGEWSKFDSSGSQTQGGMGSDRLLSLPERGEQEDRAGGEDMWVQELRPWQQRMDWFSQQQKENEKRLSLQHGTAMSLLLPVDVSQPSLPPPRGALRAACREMRKRQEDARTGFSSW